MIKNYFKIAWRNLIKHKGFTIINITGLALGIAACLLISLYIVHETSYDKHIPNSDNIYRVVGAFIEDGVVEKDVHVSAPWAAKVKELFEEVEDAGRIMDNPLIPGAGANDLQVAGNVRIFHEENFAYADQAVIDIFQVPFVHGDAANALTNPSTIIISESRAQKLFGDENPVGQSVYLNNDMEYPYEVAGIFKDFPENSHLGYTYFLSLKGISFGAGEQTRWFQNNYKTYLQLKPETAISQLEKRITRTILADYTIPSLKAVNASWADDMAETILDEASTELQPVTDIHLYSTDISYDTERSDIRLIWTFGAIALFILFIACINFINLSTARSANRAREIGLKKVIGSNRNQLILQFLSESVLMAGIALGMGVLLAQLLLPYFNNIIDKNLFLPLNSLAFWMLLAAIVLIIGILAGLYPSLYLSGFSPKNALQGKVASGSKSSGLRSGLVIFQFTISIILISGTFIVQEQMDYILHKRIGFNKDQVIQIYGVNALKNQLPTFRQELENMNGIIAASSSDYLPIAGTKRNSNMFSYKTNDVEISLSGQAWDIDENYIPTLGMNLLEGRNFDPTMATDEGGVIINEKMAAQLGLKNPIGKTIYRFDDPFTVVGIVEDFHFETLQSEVSPVALFNENGSNILSVRVKTGDMANLLAAMENKWNAFIPNHEFRYSFMDETFAAMYNNVKRMGQILVSFSLLAVFIACLGLFALASFIVAQRRKEMSIRKVLGASANSIFRLLTSNFLILVGISIFIAVPITFYFMNLWLQDYAYRITISWKTFAAAGILAIIVALITISYHALKIAFVNPSNNLRSE